MKAEASGGGRWESGSAGRDGQVWSRAGPVQCSLLLSLCSSATLRNGILMGRSPYLSLGHKGSWETHLGFGPRVTDGARAVEVIWANVESGASN